MLAALQEISTGEEGRRTVKGLSGVRWLHME